MRRSNQASMQIHFYATLCNGGGLLSRRMARRRMRVLDVEVLSIPPLRPQGKEKEEVEGKIRVLHNE